MKHTSIITVNFNQPKVTIDFLKSVKANTSIENVEVILVDNGSREDHEETYKAVYPQLIYIRSAINLGFAGGNNLGIKVAKGDYLLLLNNDTEITSNLVETLVAEFENNPEIGILSPLLLYFDQPEVIQYAGFTEMNYLTCRNKGIGSMAVDSGQYDSDSRETGYCHGAAMMCRKRDLETTGPMAELFFLYYEELDWCEKFKKAGKKIWFTGKTRVYHKESISVGKESDIKTYFMTRNRMLFIRRNTGTLNTLFFSTYYILIACSKQVLVYLLKGRSDLIKWVFKAILWNFTNSKNSNKLGFKINNK
jgi:GT2 family glycosyltransferase